MADTEGYACAKGKGEHRDGWLIEVDRVYEREVLGTVVLCLEPLSRRPLVVVEVVKKRPVLVAIFGRGCNGQPETKLATGAGNH
jgi:hypothetical protein